jgi:hypothetical protein
VPHQWKDEWGKGVYGLYSGWILYELLMGVDWWVWSVSNALPAYYGSEEEGNGNKIMYDECLYFANCTT